MPPSGFGGVLLRRWRIVLVGILVTVGLSISAFFVVPASYEAKALIVLLPPRVTVGTGGNPYLELGGLGTASAVLALAMNTTEVADALAATNPNATFTVEQDPSTSGPVLAVTVEDTDPAAALSALDGVVRQADPRMAKLQTDAGAPGDNLITVAVVTRDTEAAIVRRVQMRVVLVAAALGLLLTLVCVALLERRSRPHQPPHQPMHHPVPQPRSDGHPPAANGAGWVPGPVPGPAPGPAEPVPRAPTGRRPPGPNGASARRPRPNLGPRSQAGAPASPSARDERSGQT